MYNYVYETNKLIKLFQSVKEKLTENDVNNIETHINAGEWVLAFEDLCTQIHEHQACITQEIYTEFEKVGRLLEVREKYCLRLKDLIMY